MNRFRLCLIFIALLSAGCGPLTRQAADGAPAGPSPETVSEVFTAPLGVTVTPSDAPSTEPQAPTYDPFTDERPLGQVGFVIPPTVQHVTESTAEILFQLETPQAGALMFGPQSDESLIQSVALDAENGRHVVRLEGLASGASYRFVVRLGEGELEALDDVPFLGELWGPQNFRTPPYDEPLRFAVIGDSGFADSVTPALVQRMVGFDPQFVLHLGDIVYHVENYSDPYAAFQAAYYTPFKPLLQRVPLYPVVGNHDLDPPTLLFGTPFYFWAFPPINDSEFPTAIFNDRRNWYAFSAGSVQFIALNTQTIFGQPGHTDQMAWLEERLADSRFDYSIVFFHVAPYSSGLHGTTDGPAVQGLAAILEDAGVPVVFSGHEHLYERVLVGPTNYFVSGGGSAVLYERRVPSPYSQVFASQSHYLEAEITSDTIVVRVVSIDGSLLDEVSLPTPPK